MGMSARDLAPAHLEVILSGEVLVGASRHLALFEDLAAEKRVIAGPMAETIDFIRVRRVGHRVVVLASGDPLFFGIGHTIAQALGRDQVSILPNITSIAAAFARIGEPWGEAAVVSLHGRNRKFDILSELKAGRAVAVLTDERQSPQWLARWLAERGNGAQAVRMAVFERLGSDEEALGWYTTTQAAEKTFAQPNVVILKPPEEGPASRTLTLGVPDEDFLHEKGLITKAEVRAVTLAKLRLKPGLTLWDLGAGSGAVGIEASVLIGAGRVIAVEQHAGRVDQIRQNASRYGVYTHETIQARLPGGLAGLPRPDRVFIGGGGRDMAAIIREAVSCLNPGGVVVINTVLLDNLNQSLETLRSLGLNPDVVQLQVSRSREMPWSRRLEAHNPVWILSGRLSPIPVDRSPITEDCCPVTENQSPVTASQPAITESRKQIAGHRSPVIFCGAGPGDPELITVKGMKALAAADLVLYAGSLVPEAVLNWAPEGAQRISSAGMDLARIITCMAQAHHQGRRVVRLHTGDPSLYGAIREQMAALREQNIPCEVIPGVSAAFAAAAALGIEYTVPERTQTLILTRMAGRTPVPESENLEALARHGASLAIYLSMGQVGEVGRVLSNAYGPEARCAVACRVSHPRLLNQNSTTRISIMVTGLKDRRMQGKVALWSLTPGGLDLAGRLAAQWPGSVLLCTRRLAGGLEDRRKVTFDRLTEAVAKYFHQFEGHLFMMAAGIVVRAIAPHLTGKTVDPAVVVVDDRGRFAVSLVSGHIGGANRLARQTAEVLGAVAVITTATDSHGKPAIDLIASERGLSIENPAGIKNVNMALLADEPVWVHDPAGWLGITWVAGALDFPSAAAHDPGRLAADAPAAVWVDDTVRELDPRILVLRPPSLVAGIGCNRGTALEEIRELLDLTLARHALSRGSLSGLASIDLKADEAGLCRLAAQLNLPIRFFTREELLRVEEVPTPSAVVSKHAGVPSVCEASAILAGRNSAGPRGGELIVPKQIGSNATVAIARRACTSSASGRAT